MSHYARLAIVTGATSGIGEATARKLDGAGFGVTGNGHPRKQDVTAPASSLAEL